MKKNLLLLLGLSLLSVFAFGQQYEKSMRAGKISEFKNRMSISTTTNPINLIQAKTLKPTELEAHKLVVPVATKSYLKSAVVKQSTIDTLHIYPWNYLTQDWDTIPVAMLLSYYDQKQNLTQYRALSWHNDTQSYIDSVQYFYKYNDAGQIVNTLQQQWQFDGIENYSWVNIDNSVTEYNSLGQESKFVYQTWNYDTNDWLNAWQHEFTYDSIGNNTSILESYWDGSSQWTPGMKFVNKYDLLSKITLNLIQYLDNSTNNWINNFQYLYEYDANGCNISLRIQTWNTEEGGWDNYYLESLTYNNLKKIENYLVQVWDPFLFEWSDFERGIYKYDSNGNNTCILGQAYDSNSNTWNESWVNYYDYNDQNKQISSSSLYWDASLGSWASGSKTKSLKINKDKQNAAQPAVESTVEVFPNPVIDVISIRNKVGINQVQVFDVTGSEILLKQYSGSNAIQLDVTALKSGLYLLNIKNADGSFATKRVIKK